MFLLPDRVLFLSFFQFDRSASFFLLPPVQRIVPKTIRQPVPSPDECQYESKNNYCNHEPFSNIIHGVKHTRLILAPGKKNPSDRVGFIRKFCFFVPLKFCFTQEPGLCGLQPI
jgi:hypothetical protein